MTILVVFYTELKQRVLN